ncbi:hypothetical protein BgiMline_009290 [Biomphalaria glabrata]|nr:hypothetical protein BgiBS90_014405 [Biomphalaria glabrata]
MLLFVQLVSLFIRRPPRRRPGRWSTSSVDAGACLESPGILLVRSGEHVDCRLIYRMGQNLELPFYSGGVESGRLEEGLTLPATCPALESYNMADQSSWSGHLLDSPRREGGSLSSGWKYLAKDKRWPEVKLVSHLSRDRTGGDVGLDFEWTARDQETFGRNVAGRI